MSMESSSASGELEVTTATETHGGRYVVYNLYNSNFTFEVPKRYVPPIRLLGSGSYGIVCAAIDSNTQKEVAIKKIQNAFGKPLIAKRTLREIMLLRHMDHENIVAIKAIVEPPEKDNFNDVYIVYELMHSDLDHAIQMQLTDEQCQSIIYQLLRGLKYVHSANVLHRDLKPSNLLLNKECHLKIADFGLARTTSKTDPLTDYVVTRTYRAPELLLKSQEYTAAIDIWSVGCIFGEMMARKPLFPGKNSVDQLQLIIEFVGSPDESSLGFLRNDNTRRRIMNRPQRPRQDFAARFHNMSEGAIDLLEKMLVFDPNKRITVDEALRHPYLAHLHDEKDEPVCPTTFDFDFEQSILSLENMKEMIWNESQKFNQTS